MNTACFYMTAVMASPPDPPKEDRHVKPSGQIATFSAGWPAGFYSQVTLKKAKNIPNGDKLDAKPG